MSEEAYNGLLRQDSQDIKAKALIRLEQLRISLGWSDWEGNLIFKEQALETITRNIKAK